MSDFALKPVWRRVFRKIWLTWRTKAPTTYATLPWHGSYRILPAVHRQLSRAPSSMSLTYKNINYILSVSNFHVVNDGRSQPRSNRQDGGRERGRDMGTRAQLRARIEGDPYEPPASTRYGMCTHGRRAAPTSSRQRHCPTPPSTAPLHRPQSTFALPSPRAARGEEGWGGIEGDPVRGCCFPPASTPHGMCTHWRRALPTSSRQRHCPTPPPTAPLHRPQSTSSLPSPRAATWGATSAQSRPRKRSRPQS